MKKNGKTMQKYANLFFGPGAFLFISVILCFFSYFYRLSSLGCPHTAVCVVILVCFSFRFETKRKLFELCMLVAPFVWLSLLLLGVVSRRCTLAAEVGLSAL